MIRLFDSAAFRVFMGCGALVACGQDPVTAPVKAVEAAECAASQVAIGSFVDVSAGRFVTGQSPLYREEVSSQTVHVAAFSIQAHEVTNAQFAAFVAATGYVTEAETGATSDEPGAGSAVFVLPSERRAEKDGWMLLKGATWTAPTGPGSDIAGLDDLPVVHVSMNDAAAYAQWAGGRLPTAIEVEYAANLGLPDPSDSASSAYRADKTPIANTWQGIFPMANLETDGFEGAAPVGCFAPSRIGLYDLIGNVWEWTDTPYGVGTATIKGGSFLCADNFCRRYRPAARQPQDVDFSTNHIGFRVVKDLPDPGAGN
ncbi:MAG: SUMF1/EgtB/PvdO family nonheme iron enzyme [Pseudomonadota bacterium]